MASRVLCLIDNRILETATATYSEGQMTCMESIVNWYSICGRLLMQILITW